MRRPRHREKSPLIYKMLGLAALAGLSMVPILIGLGTTRHVRSLVPVQLVTIAPPRPPAPVVHTEQPISPRVEQVALISTPRPKTVLMPAAPPKTSQKPPARSPSKRQVAKKPSPKPIVRHTARAVPDASAAHRALAARKARADEREKHAHRLAVAMAARRAAAAHAASAAPAKAPVRTATKVPKKTVRVAARPSQISPNPPVTPPVLAPPDLMPPDAPDPPPAAAPTSAYVPAEALFQPQPTVPDSLLVAPLHAVFRCRFLIHPDGMATVQTLRSTGRAILDRRALEAARRWRFQPARRDGKPVESVRTVEMTFNVRPVFDGSP